MDKRRTIVGILLMVLAILGWTLLQYHYRQQAANNPHPPATQPATQPATAPSTEPTTGPATSVASTGTNPSTHPTTTPAVIAPANALAAPSAPVDVTKPLPLLGSKTPDDAHFAMGVQLSPIGAGVDDITLNEFRSGEDFKKPLKERALYTMQSPYLDHPDASRPFATDQIIVDGKPLSLGGVAWKLESAGDSAPRPGDSKLTPASGQQAVYSAVVTQSGDEKLKLTKTFTLFSRGDATKGYEVSVDYKVENVGKTPVSVQMVINGPTLPPREFGRSFDRQLMAGYLDPGTHRIVFSKYELNKFKAESPSLDITKGEKGQPISWAGTASTYFNAFVLFEKPEQIAKVTTHADAWNEQPETRPVYMDIETTAQSLQPGASYLVPMTGFFGPRWRDVLSAAPYSEPPRQYNDTLIITSGPCGFCAFDWLINVLVWLLNSFHWLAGGFPPLRSGDWGLAIILLVALVRILLHPITKMSQVQMVKMGKMGPALQKLKEKHADDKEAYTKAQMELMKEQGMAPVLGCLPMFLQMPIWIALWQALQSTFELRQAPFLWGATWIKDLSRPDYLIKFSNEVPLVFGWKLDGINLLPILMAIIFHVQARIQNRLQPAATPEQESQKKMMMWMSTFLFPLFLYNGPSGLNLYILTSTFVGIIESKRIRDHIKERDAKEKLAPVVVDGPGGKGKAAAATAKRGGLMGWLQRMSERAEEMKREQEKKARKK